MFVIQDTTMTQSIVQWDTRPVNIINYHSCEHKTSQEEDLPVIVGMILIGAWRNFLCTQILSTKTCLILVTDRRFSCPVKLRLYEKFCLG